MTLKERVLQSLNHQETGRIPFLYRDVSDVRSRLKKDLNLTSDEELFRFLDIDFRWVEPKYIGKPLNIPNDNKMDIWGVGKNEGGTYDKDDVARRWLLSGANP